MSNEKKIEKGTSDVKEQYSLSCTRFLTNYLKQCGMLVLVDNHVAL
jgi:hypothetical protein